MPGGGAPTTFDPSVLVAASTRHHVLSSKALQQPMSKLAYLANSPELLQFPNASGLEKPVAVLGGSQVSAELVDRGLTVLWSRHCEHMAKQVSPVSLSLWVGV